MSIKKKIAMALVTTALGATLIGAGTFALFTDTAINAGNTFTAGTLDITVPEAAIFNVTNIAPGDSGSATLEVTNSGSLELRYDLTKALTGDLAAGADGLAVNITDANGNAVGDDRVLASGASETLTVNWSLPIAAGNEYQGDSASLSITADAEQTRNN